MKSRNERSQQTSPVSHGVEIEGAVIIMRVQRVRHAVGPLASRPKSQVPPRQAECN